jgi:hypothetical protein
LAHKKYSLIRTVGSEKFCVYGKRLVDLPSDKLPVPGLEPDLKWYEMQFSSYPQIDVNTQGVTYTETLEGDLFKVTYESFLIADGVKNPVTIPRGN